MVCELFDVPRSTFYERRSKPVDEKQQALSLRIASIFKESRASAGSRTIVRILRAENTNISRFRVMRLMANAGLQSKQPGSHTYKVATVERIDIPNALARNFKPERPNQVWTGDITYIWAGRWVEQLKSEHQGITPSSKALTAEQQRIQELEKRIKRLELEKEILKKATALLMSDEYKNMR